MFERFFHATKELHQSVKSAQVMPIYATFFDAIGKLDFGSTDKVVEKHLQHMVHSWKWQSCAFLLHECWVCYEGDFWDIDTSNATAPPPPTKCRTG